MKRALFAAFLVVFAISPLAARQWTYRGDGGTVEAELVDVKGGNVILKRPDGSQLNVPIGKLSLGDIRYIKEELKAAEAGLGDGSKDSSAGQQSSQEKTPAASAKPAPKADTTVDAAKLRYKWKTGQELVYRVKVVGTQGDYSENISGTVTYKVNSATDDEAELEVIKAVTNGQPSDRVGVVVYQSYGPHFRHGPPHGAYGPSGASVGVIRFFTIPDTNRTATLTINSQGRTIHVDKAAPLPYMLGDLSEMMFEPFSTPNGGVWSNETTSTVESSSPFRRYVRAGSQTGVPANEKTVYTIQGQSGNRITIAKHYELTTTAQLNGKPQFQASGDGKLTFDTDRGAFCGMTYDVLVTARQPTKTEEVPFHVTYQLTTEEELAAEKKKAEERRIAGEKALAEMRRPMTDAEIDAALADLTSGDPMKVRKSMRLFTSKTPQKPSVKAAKALEAVMLDQANDGGTRADAAKALKVWGSRENVKGLVAALADEWVGTRNEALEALMKYKPAAAIAPIANMFAEHGSRHNAAKALKAYGSAAEDAVLPFVADKDDWTAAEACKLLESIGTKKSLDALNKATKHHSWMVNQAANKAIQAIERRESVKPK